MNGFNDETRPDEDDGRDDVPFAEPEKRDAEDHGYAHHLQEVEEHVVAVADDEVNGKGGNDSNSNADKEDLDAALENCGMIFVF